MEVIEYLKQYGPEKLTEEFAISVKSVDDLLVLNYNQIESPKTNPLVIECRSLILDNQYSIVSRSMDRFFNYGEALNVQPEIDFSKAICYEKVDGSLIKIYNHKGVWLAATRGTAYAESPSGFGHTFKSLVLKALECEEELFQDKCNEFLCKDFTYIFELTSVENRVVKRYDGYTLHYLTSRHNQTGGYGDSYEKEQCIKLGAREINKYKFSGIEECIRTVRNLKDLDEGYVVYQDGVPVSKIKSPAYLAVHAIRGEGLTPKRIMQLVLVNEQDEYLTYFPEDEKFFTEYVAGMKDLISDIEVFYDKYEGIECQKEFANKVKEFPFSGVMFQARKNKTNPVSTFHDQSDSFKMKVLEKYV